MDILASSNSLHSSNLQISVSNKLPTTLSLGIVEAPDESQQAGSFPSFPRHLPNPSLVSVHRFRGKLSSLDSVKQLHAQVVKLPKTKDSDDTVWNLIRAYLKFSDFRTSAMVFFLGLTGHTGSCESFLEEYEGFGGDPYKILEVFAELWGKGVKFDARALSHVLKLCAVLTDAWLGLEIHACLVKRGFDLKVDLKSSLMDFYHRCWDAESADRVFDEMPKRNSHLWKEKIVESLQKSNPDKALELFKEMHASCVEPDVVTVSKTLQACGKLRFIDPGKQIHGYVFRKSMESDMWICNSLINLYSKNAEVAAARKVFNSMKTRNLSTWNSMISGYASLGHFDEVWKLFGEMNKSPDTKPDAVTWNCLLINNFRHGLYQQVLTIFRSMLAANVKPTPGSINPAIQAASELKLFHSGREIHCYVVKNGLDYDEYVVSILLEMYLKSNNLDKARTLFDHSTNKNIVAWNSLIFGYASKALFDEATELLNKMKEEEGIEPDIFTYNGLLSGYATNGQADNVSTVLHQMENSGVNPNIVSWTAILSGCSKSGNFIHAFKFFKEMLETGNNPTPATLCCLLQSCAGLSLLQTGKEIHCVSLRNSRLETPLVATALIDMYIKSGSLDSALKIFSRMNEKTVGTWNCMMTGFAIHGQGQNAIDLFEKMLQEGLKPDAVTFTALLSACKNSGLIDMGWRFFDSMKSDYDITPTIEHYSCIVDLLGRSGYLDEAIDFIRSMPLKPDASIWGALLRSCRIHNNLKLGKIAAQQLFKMEPTNSTNYVHLMNLYSMANRWKEVDLLKEKMDSRGIKPQRSWCWVQVGDDKEAHVFTEEDSHPEEGKVYYELFQLVGEMKEKDGYVPDIKCVYQNISDADKEKVLMSHPEKLAITYGLIKKKEHGDGSRPIRVIKNTRMCRDCHAAAKAISVVRKCDIVVKDGVRFHHFRRGRCSCNDYW